MKEFPGEYKQSVMDVILSHKERLIKANGCKATLTAIVSRGLVIELQRAYGLKSEFDCAFFIVMGIHCKVNPDLKGSAMITVDNPFNFNS